MSRCQDVPVRSEAGRELLRQNKNQYKVDMIQGGKVWPAGCEARNGAPKSDVEVYDTISYGYLKLAPYSILSYSTQPERNANLYQVYRAKVSDMTASGLPLGSGSSSLAGFLSGTGMFEKVVHAQPNPLLPWDTTQTPEYMTVGSGLEDDMAERMRTISVGSYRLPTDLVAQSEELMTEGYFDMSATRAANLLQWSRGIGTHKKPDQTNDQFLSTLAQRTPGYARNYPVYGLIG